MRWEWVGAHCSQAPVAIRRDPIIAAMQKLLGMAVLLVPVAAAAEVYRCTQDGRTVYTDRPCSAEAAPADLPPIHLTPAGKSADLAADHDARIRKGRERRDAADAKFVQAEQARQERAKTIRQAIIDRRAIVGMSASELDSALGAPDARSGKDGRERWIWNENDHRLTVTLRDGRVTAISKQESRKP